jgi:chemotaxis protein CheX
MGSANPYNPEFPFTAHTRAADRELLLAGIVETVWESVLGLPILLRAPEDLDEHPGGATLTASLRIAGAWNGTVATAGPASVAAECAGHMLGVDPHALSPRDVGDAWGELANMIAGNLKALVPPPSRVSLPTIVEGLPYSYRIPGARVLNELTFACLGKRIRVTVLEQETD